MLWTDATLMDASHIACIIWKEAKLLTSNLTRQQQMLTAQLSTSMLLCLSNSHCAAADFMYQQNNTATRKEHAS